MNLTALIRLKEKIATTNILTIRERDFLLELINEAVRPPKLSDEQHATGRTKAGNDISGI